MTDKLTAIGLTYDEMMALKPCADEAAKVAKALGGRKKWNGIKIGAAQAVAAGVSLDNLVWVASAVAQTDKDVGRRLRLWAADCAAHVLPLYEKHAPADTRVRDCIIAARRFARGEIDRDAASAAAKAARDAAWAAGDAEAAASAAAWVAEAAWAAARAASAASDDSYVEEKWQLYRLVVWLSDPEPEDWVTP